ncbi:unnamed protein product [Chironomus riparius]|uniref:Ionotropic receptor n=1 Tax=Chironomus riparius TaxID=315576 RepID=A0A9N9WNM9_9DIPT|nr:unnamed protein product [Chironomus riparius]
MKSIFVILLLFVAPIFGNKTVRITKFSSTALEIVENSSQKWNYLCKTLTNIILNTNLPRNDNVEVAILTIGDESTRLNYDGFYKAFQSYGSSKIAVEIFKLGSDVKNYVFKDFVIFLLDEVLYVSLNFIKSYFHKILLDRSAKIICILNFKTSSRNLKSFWSDLTGVQYYNVYIIKHQDSGDFQIFRTKIIRSNNVKLQIFLGKSSDDKFLTMSEIVPENLLPSIRVLFYNSYPMSYVDNGIIKGTEGNLIQEFSHKIGTPYQIVNKNISYPSLNEIKNIIESYGDISLYAYINVMAGNIKTIYLNEMHGLCLLAPRNIPVSAYENFKFPLDTQTIVIALVSALSVIITWRMLTRSMSITSIIFAVGKMILNIGTSGIERLTFRENILIYCFMFSSFIMATFYESIFMSFMLAKSSMRSAYNLEELNSSNTKFYSFYGPEISQINNMKSIRPGLVMNYVKFNQHLSLDVPEEFDENLVYMIYCDYGDFFIESPRNYRNGHRLFNKIILNQYFKTYNIRRGYFYVQEFEKLVHYLTEAGIYKFWKMQDSHKTIRNSVSRDFSTINAEDMGLPIYTLFFGCVVALSVLLFEMVTNRFSYLLKIRMRSITNHKLLNNVQRKKLRLRKWSREYLLKQKFSTKLIMQSTVKTLRHQSSSNCVLHRPLSLKLDKNYIKSRESIVGSYFALKKFYRNYRREFKVEHGIIQVKLCSGPSTGQVLMDNSTI